MDCVLLLLIPPEIDVGDNQFQILKERKVILSGILKLSKGIEFHKIRTFKIQDYKYSQNGTKESKYAQYLSYTSV